MKNLSPNFAISKRNKNFRVLIHVLGAALFGFVFILSIQYIFDFIGVATDTKIRDIEIYWAIFYLLFLGILAGVVYFIIWWVIGNVFRLLNI
jgi:hypothetical protein